MQTKTCYEPEANPRGDTRRRLQSEKHLRDTPKQPRVNYSSTKNNRTTEGAGTTLRNERNQLTSSAGGAGLSPAIGASGAAAAAGLAASKTSGGIATGASAIKELAQRRKRSVSPQKTKVYIDISGLERI